MTYLFKLARRISCIRPATLLALSVLSACSKGDQIDYVGPNPNPPPATAQALRVEPQIATAEAGTEIQFTASGYTTTGTPVPVVVDWSATGGSIMPDGRFTGDLTGNFTVTARVRGNTGLSDSAKVSVSRRGNRIVEVIVSPDSAIVEEGDTVRTDAVLRLEDGTLAPNAVVTWSTDGGSIDAAGNFMAPVAGAYGVKAQALNGVEGRATVVVHNKSRTLISLAVSPSVTNAVSGQSIAFIVTPTWSDHSFEAPDVIWSATGGTISSDGVYRAGSKSGDYLVVARFQHGTIADTAHITIAAPTVALLSITPGSAALAVGASQQFGVLAQLSDASWRSWPVTWTATSGTITASGLYKAGSAAGTFKVIATAVGAPVADTVLVTVAQPAATLVSLTMNPSSATVPIGQTRQFDVTAHWSDGTSFVPPLTWTATGGTVSATGLYTGGATPGTYAVTAKGPGGVTANSAVTIAAPVVTQMDLSPHSVSVLVGQTVQFSVTGTLSNGVATTPAVSWIVAGGTMNATSLFTAGTSAGTYAIVATVQGGTLADTSFVTITVPAPVLTSLVVTPASRAMAPGGSGDFNVLGSWSDGSSGAPAVTWTVTGGVMVGRKYVAGALPGSYKVIATDATGTLADTSVVTITSPVNLTALTVSPTSATVIAGVTRQFSVSALWSNGTRTLPGITWTATGGSVTSAGRYTAGSTPGSFWVYAKHSAGTIADSAAVTVAAGTPPAATLVGLSIAPNPVSLMAGTTSQFAATAVWSDGTTTLPALTWTATGGTISATGLYTAGSTPGTYQVISTGGGVADTSAVTVTAVPPPTLTSIVLTPASTSLVVGTTQQFTVTGHYSDGTTGSVPMTWSATGGIMSAGGIYSAGMSAGTYRVIATQVAGTMADTAVVTVTAAAPPPPPPPPPSSGWNPNEPAGMSWSNDRAFDSKVEKGWTDRGDPAFSIVTDAAAPRSANNVGQARFSPGLVPGSGPIQTSFTGLNNARTLYISFWLKLSSNWYGGSNGVNKVLFANIGTNPLSGKAVVAVVGTGAQPLQIQLRLQAMDVASAYGAAGGAWNAMANMNIGAATIVRGKWQHIEAVLVANTPGQLDGQVHFWVDGVKVGQYTSNVGWCAANETGALNVWSLLKWNPTWGGTGPTVPADQYMWIDHLYSSGK